MAIHKWNIVFIFAGITDENLDKLLSHALIPMEKKNVITNMQYLNLQIIQEPSRVSDWSIVRLLFKWHLQRESGVSPDLGRATALHVASELFIKSSGVISLFFFDIPSFFFFWAWVNHLSSLLRSVPISFLSIFSFLLFISISFLFRLLMFCRHEFDVYFSREREGEYQWSAWLCSRLNVEKDLIEWNILGWKTKKHSTTKKRTIWNNLYQFTMDTLYQGYYGGKNFLNMKRWFSCGFFPGYYWWPIGHTTISSCWWAKKSSSFFCSAKVLLPLRDDRLMKLYSSVMSFSSCLDRF